ncbi:MAG: AbrB/MazE/SpoVT family DNA-binding domain-containing protein [Candidatus Omnitrophica bacterium]|nr:AbrB/MazE/SpoVT family DNA-binding domain-containing protein [Candidatus Omnitrophota bacterium]
MVVKVSSKHQVTIPKNIAEAFDLKKGDVLEVTRKGNKIVMVPKEVIYKEKYPQKDLETAEKVLSEGLPEEEVSFKSGPKMIKSLKKRIKK